MNFVNNRNGRFAYVSIGGANQVKAYRRGAEPKLIATIAVGNLPHGLWPSGDGSRIYGALENGSAAAAIDTLTNKVVANIPIGQTSQALVYVPGAVPEGSVTENLAPLGEAGNTAQLHLESAEQSLPNAQASVAVNSLGLTDLVQIAAEGLAPKAQYDVFLADSSHPPYGKLQSLASLRTNPDGAGIVQAIAQDARPRRRQRFVSAFAQIYCHRGNECTDPCGATTGTLKRRNFTAKTQQYLYLC